MLKRSEALPKVKEWIEANFEDKKGGCVAKRDIFDAYVAFCRAHNYQTTNDATFGKIFKTIFPHVQVRRLVRRVKAKKWHYCDVAYRQDSPLAVAAGPALSTATTVATDDDDCSEDGGISSAKRTKAAATTTTRCSGSSRTPKKRKRSTSAQKKAHLSESDDEEEKEETATNNTKKRRSRGGEEEEEEEHDEEEEDGDYVEHQPTVQAAEEDEVDGGTPSAGTTGMWSDSEDESSSSSSSSSCYASPLLPGTSSKPVTEIKHEEDKDLLQSSTDTPVCHTPSERAPAPTRLATNTTGLSLGGGDIDLSASSVIRVSSMLHSSSAFPLLADTSAGLPPFGPATTRRLDESSELGSEAPPSLTSSSAEMFFSYQPASSTALADFVKAEPSEEAEPEKKPARRHPPTPTASTVDREQIAPHAVTAAPPALAPAYAHARAHHAHAFPAHYPTHESGAPAPAEPSPFEASRNLPIHSQTMTNLLLGHGHTTSTFSMPTPASYAYAPTAPQHIHASSTASANQASAFLPGQQQHYQHYHQHQHHPHQHQQHHQQFSYPPYPIAQQQPPPFASTAASPPHPSFPQQTGHQTDREMSPESVEIFISHLLTDKSSEVMTLRPQQQ